MEKIYIEPLQPKDTVPAAVVLARAFSVELNNLAIFRYERDMERRQKPLFLQMLKEFPGIVLVARQENTIVGVLCMVEWPKCQMPRFKALQYFASMLMVLREGLLREMRLRRIWAKHDPKEPHWHIGPIGVEPDFQGRGIGSGLITHFLMRVDENHKPAYLETDSIENVRFYRCFGFSVVGEETINEVSNWFMWRPAC